uniref:Uncharacterized protein n=1 Tax=Meloidogyne javanica TaxID=6303 RepID=A0A915NDX0_MELJA
MNNNNNENSSLSPITPSTQLPRARSAIFPDNDLSTMNKLYSTRLAGTLSTDDDDPAVLFPVGTSNPCTTGVNSSDMIFTDHQRKQSNPPLSTLFNYSKRSEALNTCQAQIHIDGIVNRFHGF